MLVCFGVADVGFDPSEAGGCGGCQFSPEEQESSAINKCIASLLRLARCATILFSYCYSVLGRSVRSVNPIYVVVFLI